MNDWWELKWRLDEFCNSLEEEIYNATKPRTKDRYRYIVTSDRYSDWTPGEKKTEFRTRREANRELERWAPKKELGDDGKWRRYREYIHCVHTAGGISETTVKEYFSVVRIEKGHFPEYSKKTLKAMRNCLLKMREAEVCAEEVYKLLEGDTDERDYRDNLAVRLGEVRRKPLVDTEFFERQEGESD